MCNHITISYKYIMYIYIYIIYIYIRCICVYIYMYILVLYNVHINGIDQLLFADPTAPCLGSRLHPASVIPDSSWKNPGGFLIYAKIRSVWTDQTNPKNATYFYLWNYVSTVYSAWKSGNYFPKGQTTTGEKNTYMPKVKARYLKSTIIIKICRFGVGGS